MKGLKAFTYSMIFNHTKGSILAKNYLIQSLSLSPPNKKTQKNIGTWENQEIITVNPKKNSISIIQSYISKKILFICLYICTHKLNFTYHMYKITKQELNLASRLPQSKQMHLMVISKQFYSLLQSTITNYCTCNAKVNKLHASTVH